MRAVTLERRTRHLVQLWTTAAIAAASAALILVVLAGGTSQWVRWLLGVASIYGFAGASRFRFGLHVGALAGVAMIAVVPHDAGIDRGVVAAIGAILIMLACELAHGARRLVTIAPVQSTRLDGRATGLLVLAAAGTVAVTGGVAQVDRWGERPLIAGLAIAGVALIRLIGPADTAEIPSEGATVEDERARERHERRRPRHRASNQIRSTAGGARHHRPAGPRCDVHRAAPPVRARSAGDLRLRRLSAPDRP